MRNIFRKIGVSNRVELARSLVRTGDGAGAHVALAALGNVASLRVRWARRDQGARSG